MTSIAPVISDTGISALTYAEILTDQQAAVRAIYGSDVYIEPDSQDGQFIAALCLSYSDLNQAIVALYNSFSPATAQGVGLSNAVKINGLRREIPTNSTATVTIIGVAGTIILNGVAKDILGQQWNLPSSVTIPGGGSISVTATSVQIGNINAAANTINKISTPTLGWQTVNNSAAAAAGSPVEDDATLRRRQSVSTSISALSVIDSIAANVANISGVARSRIFENPTSVTDGNAIPSHSISAVVQGGDLQTIADTIAVTKTPGTGTYGTTTKSVVDSEGVPSTINFFVLTEVPITVEIDITTFPGYLSTTGDSLKQAVVDFINNSQIGDDVLWTRLFTPANLYGVPISETYDVTGLRIARSGSPVSANVTIAFNEAATCDISDVTLAVS